MRLDNTYNNMMGFDTESRNILQFIEYFEDMKTLGEGKANTKYYISFREEEGYKRLFAFGHNIIAHSFEWGVDTILKHLYERKESLMSLDDSKSYHYVLLFGAYSDPLDVVGNLKQFLRSDPYPLDNGVYTLDDISCEPVPVIGNKEHGITSRPKNYINSKLNSDNVFDKSLQEELYESHGVYEAMANAKDEFEELVTQKLIKENFVGEKTFDLNGNFVGDGHDDATYKEGKVTFKRDANGNTFTMKD